MSFLNLTLVGNLGGDPEMRYLPNGTPVTNFSVAVNREYSANDDKQTETTWIRVAAWGKLGEVCNQYLVKGRQVLVVGRLNPDKKTGGPRTFQRGDGTVGTSFEMTAETVRFLGVSDKSRSNGVAGAGENVVVYEESDMPF